MASSSSSAPPPPPPPVSLRGRPSSSSSSSSGSDSPPRSFLFRRRRLPRRLPTHPPSPSPSKKPRVVSPKPQLIGPLSFSEFFQKEFTPVMRDLFNTLGVLHFIAKHCPTGPSFQTYEILRSLEYITDQCADEILTFSGTSDDDSQYTSTLSPACIEPAPPDRPDLHPDLDDVWEWTVGPLRQLEDVLMNGYEKLFQAKLKITKMQATSRDTLLLRTYPQMARNLYKAAASFEAMYNVVRRQIDLEIVEAHKDRADVLADPAGDDDPPVSS